MMRWLAAVLTLAVVCLLGAGGAYVSHQSRALEAERRAESVRVRWQIAQLREAQEEAEELREATRRETAAALLDARVTSLHGPCTWERLSEVVWPQDPRFDPCMCDGRRWRHVGGR